MVSPSSNPGATADQQGDLIVVDSMRPFKTVVPKFQFWKNFIQLSEVHFESPEKKHGVAFSFVVDFFCLPSVKICQNGDLRWFCLFFGIFVNVNFFVKIPAASGPWW